MSLIQVKLCSALLKESFGDIAAAVGDILMKKGINTLRHIISATELPVNKVLEALLLLITNNLVIWDETKLDSPVYSLLNERVLLRIRIPSYIFLVQEQYGKEAEMVVDVLLKSGRETASQVIINSTLKILEARDEGISASTSIDDKHVTVRNAFDKLVSNQYIQRCPDISHVFRKNIPVFKIKEELLYKFDADSLDLKLIQDEIMNRCLNADENRARNHPDKAIFWRINYDRFHLELRDKAILDGISCGVSSMAGHCFKSILKVAYRRTDPWAPEFEPVQAASIRDEQAEFSHADQHLRSITDRGGKGLRKVGDAGGGEYVVSISNFIYTIVHSHIDTIVRERFGSKAERIFRLVRDKGMVEQDHIAEMSVLSKEETNILTRRLLNDNFLRLYDLRKVMAQAQATKNFYLFHVDTNLLVRAQQEWCYQTLYNLKEQREKKYAHNKRLLERKARVEMIVENLRLSGAEPEQIQEVEDMFTTSERQTVQNVVETQDKLLKMEVELGETMFIFDMYMYYAHRKF